MNAEGCWRCGEERHDSLFCKFCNTLQPPAQDYYRFFDLKRRLRLDPGDLARRYYSLSRMVHPDRFQRGTPNEKRFALDATAILNDAYRTLRDPVSRAEYILKEEGIEASGGGKRVPPELLEEVFEVNSALEELRGGDGSVRGMVAKSLGRFRELRALADKELDALFGQYDASGERDVLMKIRGALDRRSYIAGVIEEIEGIGDLVIG
jgi:molecular chaperone HscB